MWSYDPLKARVFFWFMLFFGCVLLFNYLAVVIGGSRDSSTVSGFLKLTVIVAGLIVFVFMVPMPDQDGEKK